MNRRQQVECVTAPSDRPDGEAAGVPEDRRLAAILAADVAGYSRLVGADEHGALRRWTSHWDEFIAPCTRNHQGRIVRVTGDGILAEFPSVVNAVRCAVALQRGMAARNAEVASDMRIEFRIGVNVGDVIVARGDVWGEGVNVAARLEAMADPGGICLSGLAHEYVLGKLDVPFEDAGERQLKNIARPIQVYRARRDAIVSPETDAPGRRLVTVGAASMPDRDPAHSSAVAAAERASRSWSRSARSVLFAGMLVGLASSAIGASRWLALSGGVWPATFGGERVPVPGAESESSPPAPPLSIVVLPFVNLSGDARQDDVADGVTDSLTSDLLHALPGSFVASRGTASGYRDRIADARQIGRDLGVRYVLGGSILLDRQFVRVNTQLVDTANGRQLWAERFDAERGGILQIQDEIVGRLSRAIGLKVVDIEARRSEHERPVSAEVIDLTLRGKAVLNRPSSRESMIGARDLFAQALDAEPANVDALAGIATTLVFEFLNGYYAAGAEERLPRAAALLDLALAAEPQHLMARKAKAALLRAQGKFDDAIAMAAGVIADNPGEPWAYKEIGLSRLYLGQSEQALDWFAKADRIGPRDPGRWTWLDGRGQALILLGRDEEAIHALKCALVANPKSAASQAFLAAAYALSGRVDQARSALVAYDQISPGTRVSTFRVSAPVPLVLTGSPYRQQRQRLEDGLRHAGMPD